MRMRALLLAGALVVPLYVVAKQVPVQPSPGTSAPQGTPPDKAQGQAPPPGARPEPTEAERAAEEKKITEAFKSADNFTLTGRLAMVRENQILLERKGLPSALLIVPGTATVQLDGRKVSLDTLTPGTEVRATFNLAQQYPIALAIEAKAPTAPTPAP